MSLLNSISINLDFEKRMLAKIHALNVSKPNGRLVCQKKGGRLFYACKRKTDTALRYIKKEDLNIVNDMKLARFVAETEKRLNANILLQEKFLAAYRPADFASVNALLPKAYQFHFDERMPYEGRIRKKGSYTPKGVKPWLRQSENPYIRENLIHKTSFGLLVRSKGELMLAESFFSAGVEFVYEKALVLHDRHGRPITVYPDFTIYLANGKILYWEHKGMFGDDVYFLRDREKMQLYYLNDIYQPKNLIVTCDGPDGGFDSEEVGRIIAGILLPQM